MSDNEIFRTDQEKFWAGEFGDDYISRNAGDELLAANVAFFSRALRRCGDIPSFLEVGANIGMNLSALKTLYPLSAQKAVEINATAAGVLKKRLPACEVVNKSILEIVRNELKADLVLIKGVLIHLNPKVEMGPTVKTKNVTGLRNFLPPDYCYPANGRGSSTTNDRCICSGVA